MLRLFEAFEIQLFNILELEKFCGFVGFFFNENAVKNSSEKIVQEALFHSFIFNCLSLILYNTNLLTRL